MSARVAHITDVNLDTAFFQAIARHSDMSQFEPVIGSLEAPGTLQESMRALGVGTFGLGVPLRSPRAVWALSTWLRRERISLLHAHCFLPTLWGLVAARLAGRPFVFTRHHSDHHQRLGRWLPVALDAWSARHAHRVIAVSEATRKVLTQTEGVPEGQVTVVHNGIEPLRHKDASGIAALRATLGLGRTETVLLVPARLHEEKGHTTLFHAIEGVVAAIGPIVVLLAGDGGHRAELETLAGNLGLSKAVRFLGRRSDVPDLMVLSDVIVVPSLAESFGFVAVEAMSLGRPLVVSSAGGLPEVVGDCGLVFPMGDSSTLASSLITMIKEPERARALGSAGRLRARQFTAAGMVRGYENVYQSVLGPMSPSEKSGQVL